LEEEKRQVVRCVFLCELAHYVWTEKFNESFMMILLAKGRGDPLVIKRHTLIMKLNPIARKRVLSVAAFIGLSMVAPTQRDLLIRWL